MKYEPVGSGGEIARASLGETSYTNQIQTYGKMIQVPRVDFINDDLGAFADAPNRLGRGAGLALNAAFWNIFLSNVSTLFTSGNGNLLTGGGSVLSATAIATALSTFKLHTDPNGYPLGIVPRVLLVPVGLEVAASALMASTLTVSDAPGKSATQPNKNEWQSLFKVVSSSYLSNTKFSNDPQNH